MDRIFNGSSRYALFGLFVVAFVGWSTAAEAYGYKTCGGNKMRYNNQWTNMYISTTSFPAGSSWDARLQNAMWHWNNVKGSTWDFYVGRDTDGTHNRSNGRNEVYLDNGLSGSTLAVTKRRWHCYWAFGWRHGYNETDIGFNNNVSWRLGALDYSDLNDPYSFEGVALHELGHALGLNHEDRWLATMNSYYPNSGPVGHWKAWDPLPDDRQGARFLYPDSTTESDVAGSAFRRTGSGSSSRVASPTQANRGSYVTIQFTFHNMSTARKTFNIGFYLSTNDYISTGDRLLGVNTGAWADPGFSGTFSRTLYIPRGVATGQYWLGFIVDFDDGLSESRESNNYMEMPRAIQIN
ncbi:matrixin family metalloprotease [Arhodomonas sp. SL1]|uniref:matrixin family metalloprotease n=1 Tax=Arhodomonas sp. SL1 TaxID=3425691 RepID=UPI003F883347